MPELLARDGNGWVSTTNPASGCTSAGLPAKTGVGGGIVAVVPGRFAIAAFSPRLNEAGNSVRSMNAIRDIAGELGVGVFGPNPN